VSAQSFTKNVNEYYNKETDGDSLLVTEVAFFVPPSDLIVPYR
jgi:hypothetical protein